MTRSGPLRIGVVGVDRGVHLARSAELAGLRVVAVCDRRPGPLAVAGRRFGISTHDSFESLLAAPLDAVVLANAFHEHAPLAIAALGAGKHVLSETAACMTMAEGVALCEAAEASDAIYMLAENYAFTRPAQELRRLYRDGEIGDLVYAEGEYVHPMSAAWLNRISPGLDHWRNWLPVTYYCSHALAPLLAISERRPVTVNGFVIAHDPGDVQKARTARRMDTASMIAVRLDGGVLAKLLQYDLRGEGTWVRLHGNRGLAEGLRHGGSDWVRLVRDEHDRRPGEPGERIYRPAFPESGNRAEETGHGGSDYYVLRAFADAVKARGVPFFDAPCATAMAAVGIQAYRSALADGGPMPIPDFRVASERAAYADDHWNPDPAHRGPDQPWPSVLGDLEPNPAGVREAARAWDTIILPPALEDERRATQ